MFSSKKPGTGIRPNPPVKPDAPAPAVAAGRAFTTYANTTEAAYSIINERLTMRGDLESEADILVKGTVCGNIRCKMLIIDADGSVEGGIVADEVVIRGRSKGTITSRRVSIEQTADVNAEIFHEIFSAEEGARITGVLHGADDAGAPGTVAARPEGPGKASHSPFYEALAAACAAGQIHPASQN